MTALHHVVEGPAGAPAVVLASSLGATHEMWDRQVPVLAERFRVVRFDRRGHGLSPVPVGPYTVDDLGADVLGLLDELGLDEVSFCGLSLGGVEGMWLAAQAPERLERLALCCTRPVFPPPEQWRDRAASVRAGGMTAIADAVLERWFTPRFRSEHGDETASFRRMLVEAPADGYASCCEALATLDLRPRLAAISAPTLVITGAADPSVAPRQGEELAAAIPGARHAVIAAAAHIANVEQPAAFAALLLDHLREDGGS